MNLIIPALAISGTILTGSPYITEIEHQAEATRILETSYYKYHDYPVYGGHDYSLFKGLDKIKKNSLVIISNKRFRVQETKIIAATDMSVLDGQTWLFTCVNGFKDRFAVLLK